MHSSKNITLIMAAMAFISVVGGALYEHIAAVPRWTSAPPLSLSMFHGKYGLDPGSFWQSVHPVTLALLIITLALNRKNDRLKPIGICVAGYILVLSVTALYFVPELLSIITTSFANRVEENLQSRASTWEMLSLVRLGVMVIIAYILLGSLTKSPEKILNRQP